MSQQSIQKKTAYDTDSLVCRVCFTVLCAVPVFFLFVFLDSRAGYDVFNYRPFDLFPPIPMYLADFSLCFSSRLLIGSITKFFSYQLTLNQLYDICCTMNIIALAVVSLICGALLRRGIKYKSFFALFVLCLAVMNPIVAQENYPAIGSYDTYWIVLFAVLMLLCKTYNFAIFAPFICFVGMLVHYGFLFSFLPAVAALLVYDIFNAEKKSRRVLSGCSLGITGLSSAFVLFYSFFCSEAHLTMTGGEFHAYLLSRLKLMRVEEIRLKRLFGDNLFPFRFFEIYFFDNMEEAGEIKDISSGRYLDLFFGYLKDSTSVEYYLKYAAAILPFMLILAVFWLACAKKAKDGKKLPFIAFAGIQSVFFFACIFSTDIYRWGATLLISQLSLLLAMLVKKDGTVADILSSGLFKNKKFIAIAMIFAAAYIVYLLCFGVHLPRTVDV